MNRFIKTHAHKITKIIFLILLTGSSYTSLQAMQQTNTRPTIAIWLLFGHNDALDKHFLNNQKKLTCFGPQITSGKYYEEFAKKIDLLKTIPNAPIIELNAVDCDDPQNTNLENPNAYVHLAGITNFIKKQVTKTENLNKIHYFYTLNNSKETNAVKLISQLLQDNEKLIIETNNTGHSIESLQKKITQGFKAINFCIPERVFKESLIAQFVHINIELLDEKNNSNKMLDETTSLNFKIAPQPKEDLISFYNFTKNSVCQDLGVEYPHPSTNCFVKKVTNKDKNDFTVFGTVELLGNLIQKIAKNEKE